jgi:hypothetical protein
VIPLAGSIGDGDGDVNGDGDGDAALNAKLMVCLLWIEVRSTIDQLAVKQGESNAQEAGPTP